MRRILSLPPSRLPLLALTVALALPLAGCTRGYGRPEEPSSQIAFGVNMARQGLWSEALFRFHQAERLDPNNVHVVNNLGVAYEASGNFEAALQQYQKALRMAPENREVRANYARFVEFYQSFRPKGKDGKPLAAPAGATRPGQTPATAPATTPAAPTAAPPPATPPTPPIAEPVEPVPTDTGDPADAPPPAATTPPPPI
jgi:tetratricopeptide (TPR) repeat protein